MIRVATAVVVATVLSVGWPAEGRAAQATQPYDFNNDGRQDLAIGVPRFQPDGTPDAGAVVIALGISSRSLQERRVIFRDTPGVPGRPHGDDQFGRAIASGDFNGDHYADLAVTAPGDRAAFVLFGSKRGLSGRQAERIPLGPPVSPDEFPVPVQASLAAADLNRDGFADLVVGAPSYIPDDSSASSGTVRLWLGSRRGFARRATRRIAAPERRTVQFGAVLALGDVDRDGHVDLVTAAPGHSLHLDDPPTPGNVTYCPGERNGPKRCRLLSGDRPGPASLAIADVTGDGFPDIVEGVPVTDTYGEDGPFPPGALEIRRGAADGPRAAFRLSPASPGIPGAGRTRDSFGAALTTADLDRDGFADMIVGAPRGGSAEGRVTVIRGGPSGYATSGHATFDQASPGIPRRRHRSNAFGAALTSLHSTDSGLTRLIIGVPGDMGDSRGVGALLTLRTGNRDVAPRAARRLSLRSLDLRAPEAPDALSTPPFAAILARSNASSSTGDIIF
jgi:hypothetical protein